MENRSKKFNGELIAGVPLNVAYNPHICIVEG